MKAEEVDTFAAHFGYPPTRLRTAMEAIGVFVYKDGSPFIEPSMGNAYSGPPGDGQVEELIVNLWGSYTALIVTHNMQ
jgi:hypothetical protein